MGQVFCSGAVHAFCGPSSIIGGTRVNGAFFYLGTTEAMPMMDNTRSWDAVMNDISGSRDPLDYCFEGEGEGLVSLVLTRWNVGPLNAIRQFPNPFGANPRGTTTLNDIGAGMAVEGNSFGLVLLYQFGAALAAKVAYPGLPVGRFYPQTLTWGPDRTEFGTRFMKEHVIFRAWKQFNPSAGTFTLYTENATAFPTLPALN